MKTSIHNFNEQTCKLFKPIQVFIHIYHITNGDPCTTGCVYYQNGKCPGYKQLNNNHEKIIKTPLITNAEIAVELCCSKRKVSKMRKNGELPKIYMN